MEAIADGAIDFAFDGEDFYYDSLGEELRDKLEEAPVKCGKPLAFRWRAVYKGESAAALSGTVTMQDGLAYVDTISEAVRDELEDWMEVNQRDFKLTWDVAQDG